MEYQIEKTNSATFADMAHEFQTPLAILRGNVELLENENGIHNRRALRVMATTIDRLSRLVARTLQRARDAATAASVAGLVSVDVLLEEVYDECAMLAETRRIVFELTRSVAACTSGDWDQLKEVLLNVVSNALQHTRAGGTVNISARIDGSAVAIEICDTGCGIKADDLPYIFERFYQIGEKQEGCLHDADTRGTGLGLAICREIIGTHHGTIDAESTVGKGSRFIVRLPMHQEKSSPADATATSSHYGPSIL
jgi:signal transduction histidine kinase